MKILVSGSNGQLGSELKDLAATRTDIEFIFFDRQTLPLHDQQAIADIFTTHQPAFFINCAAYTAVDKAEEDREQAFIINGQAPGWIAENCSNYDCKLIHISTDYVFNGNDSNPVKEDAPTGPLSVYGASKLEGEKNVLEKDPSAVIIRTSWVYSTYGNNFVKTMLRLMKERTTISVVSDQFGSPTYAADLASAILHIIDSGKWVPGIYHYSNEGSISWFDFASEIKNITGSSCDVKPIDTSGYPTPAKRPKFSVMDTSRFRSTFHLGIRNWKFALKDCLEKV
jgi:dTDP-4-dehydrorhamnose reductase